MERTTTRPLADLPALEDTSAREADADSKPDIMPAVTRKDTEMEAAMKKYEAELKAFDRIRWTDLHISHATVRYPSPISSAQLTCRLIRSFPSLDSR